MHTYSSNTMYKCGTLEKKWIKFGITHFGHFWHFLNKKSISSYYALACKGIKVNPLWTNILAGIFMAFELRTMDRILKLGLTKFLSIGKNDPTSACDNFQPGLQNGIRPKTAKGILMMNGSIEWLCYWTQSVHKRTKVHMR